MSGLLEVRISSAWSSSRHEITFSPSLSIVSQLIQIRVRPYCSDRRKLIHSPNLVNDKDWSRSFRCLDRKWYTTLNTQARLTPEQRQDLTDCPHGAYVCACKCVSSFTYVKPKATGLQPNVLMGMDQVGWNTVALDFRVRTHRYTYFSVGKIR